jgi:hypothetical protein
MNFKQYFTESTAYPTNIKHTCHVQDWTWDRTETYTFDLQGKKCRFQEFFNTQGDDRGNTFSYFDESTKEWHTFNMPKEGREDLIRQLKFVEKLSLKTRETFGDIANEL